MRSLEHYAHPSDSDAGGIPPSIKHGDELCARNLFMLVFFFWIEFYCFGVRRYFWKGTNKCVVELQTLGGKKSSIFNACNSGLMLDGKFKKIRGMLGGKFEDAGSKLHERVRNSQNSEIINILTNITTTMRPLPNLCRFLDVSRFKPVDFAILVVLVNVAFELHGCQLSRRVGARKL